MVRKSGQQACGTLICQFQILANNFMWCINYMLFYDTSHYWNNVMLSVVMEELHLVKDSCFDLFCKAHIKVSVTFICC